MGRQSSRIWYRGKDHKDIYFNGYYHDKMYIGSQLVWEKLKLGTILVPVGGEAIFSVQHPGYLAGNCFYGLGKSGTRYIFKKVSLDGQNSETLNTSDAYQDARFVATKNGLAAVLFTQYSYGVDSGKARMIDADTGDVLAIDDSFSSSSGIPLAFGGGDAGYVHAAPSNMPYMDMLYAFNHRYTTSSYTAILTAFAPQNSIATDERINPKSNDGTGDYYVTAAPITAGHYMATTSNGWLAILARLTIVTPGGGDDWEMETLKEINLPVNFSGSSMIDNYMFVQSDYDTDTYYLINFTDDITYRTLNIGIQDIVDDFKTRHSIPYGFVTTTSAISPNLDYVIFTISSMISGDMVREYYRYSITNSEFTELTFNDSGWSDFIPNVILDDRFLSAAVKNNGTGDYYFKVYKYAD